MEPSVPPRKGPGHRRRATHDALSSALDSMQDQQDTAATNTNQTTSSSSSSTNHFRNASAPSIPTNLLFVSDWLEEGEDWMRSVRGREGGAAVSNRQRLNTLERQWSMGHVPPPPPPPSSSSKNAQVHPLLASNQTNQSSLHDSWAGSVDLGSSMHSLSYQQQPVNVTSSPLPTPPPPSKTTKTTSASSSEGPSESLIHDAARITNWTTVKELCHTHPELASYAGPDGWTALHHLCNRRCPEVDVVKSLVEAYPSALIQPEEKGMMPLHYACRFKAPTDVVSLLLTLYPDKGRASVQHVDRRGRTPLHYAVRYEAPPGVMELLLKYDSTASTKRDRHHDTPLHYVWDSWAEKTEGKRTLQPFCTPLPFDRDPPDYFSLLESQSKLSRKYQQATCLLQAAFGFDNKSNGRTFRLVHACASLEVHLSLFLLALALFPEQCEEWDEYDLYPNSIARQNVLHLCANSPAHGEVGCSIMKELLARVPHLARERESTCGSLPLHVMVENESKPHWELDGVVDLYQSYPEACRVPDDVGRLPLHRAAAAASVVRRSSTSTVRSSVVLRRPTHPLIEGQQDQQEAQEEEPPQQEHQEEPTEQEEEEPHDLDGSVVCHLVQAYPEAALHRDSQGRVPLHTMAQYREVWDDEAAAVYEAFPQAIGLRAGASLDHRTPLHLCAASPDARRSLVERLVELHPRAVTQTDASGKLPLHLACEAGKEWTKGVSAIVAAFPQALQIAEANARGWCALTMAAACPTARARLVEELAQRYPSAAAAVDGQGRHALHWACASGKSWRGGLQALVEAYPVALLAEDANGLLPLHVAAFRYCGSGQVVASEEDEDRQEEDDEVAPAVVVAQSPRRTSRSASLSEPPPPPSKDEDAPKVEILFQLLRAEPSALA